MRKGEKIIIDFLDVMKISIHKKVGKDYKFTKKDLIDIYYQKSSGSTKYIDDQSKECLRDLLCLPSSLTEKDLFSASGFKKEELMDKCRKRELVVARYFIIAYQYAYTNNSLKTCGQLFGKNHATVIHGNKNIANFLSQKPNNDYKSYLMNFKNRLFEIEKPRIQSVNRLKRYSVLMRQELTKEQKFENKNNQEID